jgi:hypothetical protein
MIDENMRAKLWNEAEQLENVADGNSRRLASLIADLLKAMNPPLHA